MSRLAREKPEYGNVLMDISLIWIKVFRCFISHKKVWFQGSLMGLTLLAELDDEKPPGQEEPLQNKAIPAVVLSRAEQEQVRWIDKPNSLCFGLGNVTILSVAIDLPKVHTSSRFYVRVFAKSRRKNDYN